MPAFTLPVEDDPLPWLTEQFRQAGAFERLGPTEPTVKALSAALGLTSSVVTALSNHPKRFSVRFSPSVGTTASTFTKTHEVIIGLKPMLDPRLTDGQRASLMVALAYHEVGHVIFTAPLVKRLEKEYKPETPRGKWLFRIVNIVHDVLLEDQQPRSYPGYAPTLTVKRAYWGRLWNPTLRDRRQRLGALTQAALYAHGTDWTTSEPLAEFYAWAQDWTERCKAVKPRLGTPKAIEFPYLDALVQEAAERIRIDDATVEEDPSDEPPPGEEDDPWSDDEDPDGDAADPFDDTEDEPESDLGGESDDESDETDGEGEEGDLDEDEDSDSDWDDPSESESDAPDEDEETESEDAGDEPLPDDEKAWDDIDEAGDPGQALPEPDDDPEPEESEDDEATSGGESDDDTESDDDEDLDEGDEDEDESDDESDEDEDGEPEEEDGEDDGDEWGGSDEGDPFGDTEDEDADSDDGDHGAGDGEDGTADSEDSEWTPEAHESESGVDAAEWQRAIDEYDRVQVAGKDRVLAGGGGTFHRREVRIIRLR